MIEYKKGELLIKSDYEIRTIMEDNNDIDLFIPLDLRTLNLHLENLPNYIDNRIQFRQVRNIILRFTIEENNNWCTIHLLEGIDLQSAMLNFIIDYSQHYIQIIEEEYSIEMYIKNKII